MQDEAKRVAERFQPLFDNGLLDVKFFVPKPEVCSLPEILEEAIKIQETISAGKTRVVETIDRDFQHTSFDASF
ncbi:MAG: hypothetical protein CGW95_02825 [Phenylobacterium zucineum]|nr:MAG: hypothetical protein CGW95_02825 [Phenylobacterium zucineum]